MDKGFFVTGTDTGVGKTIITAGIAASIREKGISVGVFKPMMCGVKREDEKSDAFFLKKMSGDAHSLEKINPFQFDGWITPYLAAKRENRTISLEDVKQTWMDVKDSRDFYLIEGAGGLLVPMGSDYLAAHVAQEIGYPLLIVARPGLGTINHTLLTIDVAQRMGLIVAGVILNGLKPGQKGEVEKTNPQLIEKFSGVPVLGTVPWMEQIDRQTLIEAMEKHIAWDRVGLFK